MTLVLTFVTDNRPIVYVKTGIVIDILSLYRPIL